MANKRSDSADERKARGGVMGGRGRGYILTLEGEWVGEKGDLGLAAARFTLQKYLFFPAQSRLMNI